MQKTKKTESMTKCRKNFLFIFKLCIILIYSIKYILQTKYKTEIKFFSKKEVKPHFFIFDSLKKKRRRTSEQCE
jgi:hypothetical protein